MNQPPGTLARPLIALALLVAMLLAPHDARSAIAAGSATTFFLLTDDNHIAALTDALPSQPAPPTTITGLNVGDSLVAIDVRPQNGRLYGLGSNSAMGTVQLYHISPLTGFATPIGTTGTFVDAGGTPVPIQATRFGMDFNPAVDRQLLPPTATRSAPSTSAWSRPTAGLQSRPVAGWPACVTNGVTI